MACAACSFKIGSSQTLNTPIILAVNDVAAYKTRDIMLCIYSASPEKFKAAYRNVKLNDSPISDEIIDMKSVENLAIIHDAGNDVKMFKVDFLKIAQNIKHTQAELENATCKIGLTP